MNKLQELIDKLCPNGVEYRTLGEIGKFYGGITGKSKNDFVDGNAKFITYKNVYDNLSLKLDVDDKVKILENENQRTLEYGDIIFTGSSETPDECGISSVLTQKTDEKLYLNSFCFFLRLDDKNILNPEFSKHLFRSSNLRYQIGKTASGVTRFNVSKKAMEKVCIPVPPLEVQCEIAHILDDFTLLSAELSAELSARQRQYEYYRNKLLNVRGEIRELGSIAEFGTGSKPNNIIENFDSDLYEYINAGTTNSGYVKNTNRRSNAVTTPSRGQGGIGFVGYQENDFWLGPLCYAIYPKDEEVLNSKYLYYELMSKKDEILKRKNTGGVPSLNGCDLKTIPINVPNIEEQNKIVNILDKFYKICNDLKEGLPAEIEKRQKQYEYYRDKLLSFKEVEEDV